MHQITEQNSRFKFNLPLEIVKSDEKGWKVKGLASTEDRDLQGEIVKQNGLDISVLKAGRGLLNYEHKNDPENLVGLIENADISGKGLEIEGYLFKKHKRAQAIAEIMQSLDKSNAGRVQLSIEGKIKERNPQNQKEIKQAMIDRVAITFEPVNQNTYLNFAKSLSAHSNEQEDVVEDVAKSEGSDPKEILITEEMNNEIEKTVAKVCQPSNVTITFLEKEPVEKTLTAGYGTADAPATRTQGGALGMETTAISHSSLKDKKLNDSSEENEDEKESKKEVKPKVPGKKLSLKDKKAILKRAIERAINSFPDAEFKTIVHSVTKQFIQKFTENGE